MDRGGCTQAEHSTHSGDTHDGREGQKDPRLSLGFRVRACPVSAKIPHGAKDFPFHNGHLEVWRDVSAAGKEVGCQFQAHGRLDQGEAIPPPTHDPAWPRALVTDIVLNEASVACGLAECRASVLQRRPTHAGRDSGPCPVTRDLADTWLAHCGSAWWRKGCHSRLEEEGFTT